jgi:putative tryptophan/tyrosine transport system substrate-binding protein
MIACRGGKPMSIGPNRRAVIGGIGAAATWPLAAYGQHRAKVHHLGVLLFSTPSTDPTLKIVHSSLNALGYVEGRDLIFAYRYADGHPERLAELATALVQEKPDLLIALGGDVAPSAVKATSTIPIVFLSSADPVELGLVASLSRPATNATGITLLLDDTASKRLELLKETVPRVQQVAFLWNPEHLDNEVREAQRAAQSLNLRLRFTELHGAAELDGALQTITDAGCDALYVVSSRQTLLNLSRIVEFSLTNRLPLAGGWGAWARSGGLLAYGPNVDDISKRLVTYIDRIIKGAKPADLPVQQPTKFELVINAKAAKTLGITVPPSVLARADEIIE